MTEITLIGILISAIAQAVGFWSYFKKRNKYSASAQNKAVFVPALIFVLLVLVGLIVFAFVEWATDEPYFHILSNWEKTLGWLAVYTVAGAILNMFASILLHLFILVVMPPKYKPSKKRRSSNSISEWSK